MKYKYEVKSEYDQQLMGPYYSQFIGPLSHPDINNVVDELMQEKNLDAMENEGGHEGKRKNLVNRGLGVLVGVPYKRLKKSFWLN